MSWHKKLTKAKRESDADPLTVISLFSGAMGLDLGLEMSGFDVRVALEINQAAADTIELNRPRLPLIKQSIGDTSTKEILKAAGLQRSQVTVLSAGPCCQSFSTVGTRRSVADDRGNLFRDFCRVVREMRPRFFVMENVKGILSAAIRHRPLDKRGAGYPPLSKQEQFGSALRLILTELKKLNYYVVFGLLNAADYGVPQKRWRVFFIGSRDGEDIYLPLQTHADLKPRHEENGLRPWVTLRQALQHVDSKNWYEFPEGRLELLRHVKAGENWRKLPRHLQRRALGAALDSWGGRTGFCRRLSWREPSPTLTTDPCGRATTLCHPIKDRPLSIEEYAALQQFPKEWRFVGSLNQQYTQIGNAVPLDLGAAIGRMLRRVMNGTAREGLKKANFSRRGTVVCGDAVLERRLKRRKKTQLHPPRLRRYAGIEAARRWLRASA